MHLHDLHSCSVTQTLQWHMPPRRRVPGKRCFELEVWRFGLMFFFSAIPVDHSHICTACPQAPAQRVLSAVASISDVSIQQARCPPDAGWVFPRQAPSLWDPILQEHVLYKCTYAFRYQPLKVYCLLYKAWGLGGSQGLPWREHWLGDEINRVLIALSYLIKLDNFTEPGRQINWIGGWHLAPNRIGWVDRQGTNGIAPRDCNSAAERGPLCMCIESRLI